MVFISPFHKIAGGYSAPGKTIVQKFGYNAAVTTLEDIWESGGPYTGFLTEELGLICNVTSSSIEDDAVGGNGARTVRLEGLDADGLQVTEDVVMDGQVPVTTTTLFTRLNRAYVLTVGTTGANEGIITVDTTVGDIILATIGALEGQTLIACYTMPANLSGHIIGWAAGVSKAAGAVASAVIAIQTRDVGGSWRTREVQALNGGTNFRDDLVVYIPPLCDIRVRATSVSSEVLVSAEFDLTEEIAST